MVLDEASPQAEAAPDYDASGDTPSTSTRNNNGILIGHLLGLKVKPELVTKPDPFTLYFGFFGRANWERLIARRLKQRAGNFYELCGRLPAQDEMDAMITHGTHSLYVGQTGFPISAFATTAHLYNRARKHPAFPPKLAPMNLFTAAQNFYTLYPADARSAALSAAWKLLLYTFLGSQLTHLYAAFGETQNQMRDPRMTHLIQFLSHKQNREEIRKRRLQVSAETIHMHRTGLMKQFDQQIHQQLSGVPLPETYDYDEDTYASPTSVYSSSAPNSTSADTDTTYNTTLLNKQPTAVDGERSGSDFFSNDDDASPTAPEYRNTNIDGSPTGSAWERVRRQNKPAFQSHPQPRQPGSGSS